jgi:hypothetical protein
VIAVQLPSIADDMELLPLRYSEPAANHKRRHVKPSEFAEPGPPRQPAISVNDLDDVPRRRDDTRAYMREYMRRRRARARQGTA